MIYGIEAQSNLVGSAGAYTARIGAVNFTSTRLALASISCTDNAYFSFAGWFNSDWDFNGVWGTYAFLIDPAGSAGSSLQGSTGNVITFNATDGSNNTGSIISAPPIVSSTWQHVMLTCQTSPSRIVKCRVNDVDTAGSPFGPTFTPITSNGKALSIGADLSGDYYDGDMADVSLWPGVSFLTAGDISEATRRLFIDANGDPVDPAVAIAVLGAPAVMLTGNATQFISNSLGTSGALTVAEGSLTDASTRP